jgi:hypothetical protein
MMMKRKYGSQLFASRLSVNVEEAESQKAERMDWTSQRLRKIQVDLRLDHSRHR